MNKADETFVIVDEESREGFPGSGRYRLVGLEEPYTQGTLSSATYVVASLSRSQEDARRLGIYRLTWIDPATYTRQLAEAFEEVRAEGVPEEGVL